MSEITTKKLSEYTEEELRAMLPQYAMGYKKVTTMPETIAEGEIILYKNTLWRGLDEEECLLPISQTWLPKGYPWPVKGYMEYTVLFHHSQESDIMQSVLVNDFNLNLTFFLDGSTFRTGLIPEDNFLFEFSTACLATIDVTQHGGQLNYFYKRVAYIYENYIYLLNLYMNNDFVTSNYKSDEYNLLSYTTDPPSSGTTLTIKVYPTNYTISF